MRPLGSASLEATNHRAAFKAANDEGAISRQADRQTRGEDSVTVVLVLIIES